MANTTVTLRASKNSVSLAASQNSVALRASRNSVANFDPAGSLPDVQWVFISPDLVVPFANLAGV